MIHSKRLVQLAKRWQHRATGMLKDDNLHCASAIAGKGHCVVYSADGKRFEVPLVCLSSKVFGELLKMSEDEFGFASEDRITVPCEAAVLEYVMCLLRRKPSEEVERAVLSSVVMPCNYTSGVTLVSMDLSQSLSIF
jgi:hypothetical protein